MLRRRGVRPVLDAGEPDLEMMMTPPAPYSFETAMSSLTYAARMLATLETTEPQRARVKAQVAVLTDAMASGEAP